MRIVIQRVSSASVSTKGEVVSKIGRGLLLLVGIKTGDTQEVAEVLAKKVLKLKLFPSEEREWAESASSLGLEILSVSQFTLFAKTSKGAKPDFHRSAKSSEALPLFDHFVDQLSSLYQPEKIQVGVFGEMMSVDLANDGPVTIIIDSNDKDL